MTGRAIGARLARAQARSEAARARLADTLGTLQRRTTPRALAQDVVETLQVRGTAAITEAIEVARRKPVKIGLIAAMLGLFAARRPVLRLLRRRSSALTPSSSKGAKT